MTVILAPLTALGYKVQVLAGGNEAISLSKRFTGIEKVWEAPHPSAGPEYLERTLKQWAAAELASAISERDILDSMGQRSAEQEQRFDTVQATCARLSDPATVQRILEALRDRIPSKDDCPRYREWIAAVLAGWADRAVHALQPEVSARHSPGVDSHRHGCCCDWPNQPA